MNVNHILIWNRTIWTKIYLLRSIPKLNVFYYLLVEKDNNLQRNLPLLQIFHNYHTQNNNYISKDQHLQLMKNEIPHNNKRSHILQFDNKKHNKNWNNLSSMRVFRSLHKIYQILFIIIKPIFHVQNLDLKMEFLIFQMLMKSKIKDRLLSYLQLSHNHIIKHIRIISHNHIIKHIRIISHNRIIKHIRIITHNHIIKQMFLLMIILSCISHLKWRRILKHNLQFQDLNNTLGFLYLKIIQILIIKLSQSFNNNKIFQLILLLLLLFNNFLRVMEKIRKVFRLRVLNIIQLPLK